MGASLFNPKADFVSVIEALYAPDPDPTAWARRFLAAVQDTLVGARSMLVAIGHEDDFSAPAPLFGAAADPAVQEVLRRLMADVIPAVSPEGMRTAFYPATRMKMQQELGRELPPGDKPLFDLSVETFPAPEGFATFAYPEPGVAAVLFHAMAKRVTPGPIARRFFQRVTGHLENVLRLRTRPELAVAAVLDPAGRLLEMEPASAGRSDQRDRFATHVSSIERTRLRARRREPGALDDWAALVAGRYSLVPWDDTDGKRFYLLVHNGPVAQRHARWTPREAELVRLAARGLTGKEIAYSLGLAHSSISRALGNAARKVGLRSRVALANVAAAMFGAAPDAPVTEPLTPAERDVVELLRRGLSNAEIARLRNSSRHTVANQVSSILSKTGHASRRTLVSRRS